MRWGTRIRPLRLFLAYALALQALLGAWAGALPAAAAAIDPSSSLCRSDASASQTGDHTAPGHCVVMCLSGACASGEPPASIVVATEYAPASLAVLLDPDVPTAFPPAAPGDGLK